jgi:phosphate ABC transporter permease protein PstC
MLRANMNSNLPDWTSSVRRRSRLSRRAERADRPIFFAFGIVGLVALGVILFFVIREALPIFRYVSPIELLGPKWYPTSEPPLFGALPMIAGTILVTLGALVLALPLGFAAAGFVAEVAPPALRDLAKSLLELLAAIPSVVYGFFGLTVLAPFVQRAFGLPTGQNALTASLILGFMALPTVASLAEDALSAVPNAHREASLALGASRWETTWRVVFPSAFSGLFGAAVLGMGRAVGETMAVLMVAGNSPALTWSFLRPVRTLTAGIALEMAEAPQGGAHYHALFMLGAILLLITLATNGAAEWLCWRVARRGE